MVLTSAFSLGIWKPIWQGDSRWGSLKLGHPNKDKSQGTIGDEGCVLCASTAASVIWGGRSLNPATANMVLQQTPGAFIDPKDKQSGTGDSEVLPLVCPQLGLQCDPTPTTGSREQIASALRAALARDKGGAFVRVAFEDGGVGKHTVLACVDAGEIVECLDSACPKQEGVTEGWCAIRWSDLGADLMWGKTPKAYRIVAVRGVWAAPN